MTAAATVCVHCGGREADAQTGRCLSCGRVCASPAIVAEFSHPVLDRNLGNGRHSPSAAYRSKRADAQIAPSVAEEIHASEPPPAAAARPAEQAAKPIAPVPEAVIPAIGIAPSASWLAESLRLVDELEAAAALATEQAKARQADAKRLTEAAEEIGYLLDLLDKLDEPTRGGKVPA